MINCHEYIKKNLVRFGLLILILGLTEVIVFFVFNINVFVQVKIQAVIGVIVIVSLIRLGYNIWTVFNTAVNGSEKRDETSHKNFT